MGALSSTTFSKARWIYMATYLPPPRLAPSEKRAVFVSCTLDKATKCQLSFHAGSTSQPASSMRWCNSATGPVASNSSWVTWGAVARFFSRNLGVGMCRRTLSGQWCLHIYIMFSCISCIGTFLSPRSVRIFSISKGTIWNDGERNLRAMCINV